MRLGVIGNAGSGKTTLSKYLIKHHNFIEFSFADKIKDMLCVLLDVNKEEFEFHKITNTPLLGIRNLTARTLLQTLGTGWGRNLIDKDIWISILKSKLLKEDEFKNIIVSDIRFPNEYEMLESLNFKFIKIISKDELLTLKFDNHESESYFDSFKNYFPIKNTGTITDFEFQIEKFLRNSKNASH